MGASYWRFLDSVGDNSSSVFTSSLGGETNEKNTVNCICCYSPGWLRE